MTQNLPRKQTNDVIPDEKSGADIVEIDTGPPKKKGRGPSDPERRCIATGNNMPQSAMVRFAISPDGQVTPDVASSLPGRGAWVEATSQSIDLAISKKAFSRAFKKQVQVDQSLTEQTHKLLFRRCLDLLGFAKRAGDIILGFEQVREEIRLDEPSCLIEAQDGASDGRKKILSLAKAIFGDDEPSEQPIIIGCFTSEELGMALGRERVIHAIVKRGRSSHNWITEVKRLGGFRPLRPSDWMSLAG
ncbi:RNA-binding protein [Hirschia maritima]|uniref:RNA-binding protein n=1 Tax=Hirschia maritima TaxID=1121961 RepID=UPI00036D8180|nr:RNA-binding protein [Hirschia maritima]